MIEEARVFEHSGPQLALLVGAAAGLLPGCRLAPAVSTGCRRSGGTTGSTPASRRVPPSPGGTADSVVHTVNGDQVVQQRWADRCSRAASGPRRSILFCS
jgi:hypothetical protein